VTSTITTTPLVGFVGNVDADPELRISNTGQPYATFDLVMEKIYSSEAGEQVALVHCPVVCFDSLAMGIVGAALGKGSYVTVVGRPTWTAMDGDGRVTLKFFADEVGLDLRFVEPTP
jgi:single-stranded DNA-binding protein